jgi:hypothetical protein
MASSFFNSNNCSRSVLAKHWRLCTQLAASVCKICGYLPHFLNLFICSRYFKAVLRRVANSFQYLSARMGKKISASE